MELAHKHHCSRYSIRKILYKAKVPQTFPWLKVPAAVPFDSWSGTRSPPKMHKRAQRIGALLWLGISELVFRSMHPDSCVARSGC